MRVRVNQILDANNADLAGSNRSDASSVVPDDLWDSDDGGADSGSQTSAEDYETGPANPNLTQTLRDEGTWGTKGTKGKSPLGI